MPQQYTAQEIGEIGKAIYEKQIRPQVEATNRGKFLVVDINTGNYEIAEDDLTASNQAFAKNPDALLYGVRVGYPTAYRFGGRRLTKPL
jgi:hypothetical protein